MLSTPAELLLALAEDLQRGGEEVSAKTQAWCELHGQQAPRAPVAEAA